MQPNFHYVAVSDDWSDLEEKYRYYLRRPGEAEFIIRNANAYAKQFADQKYRFLLASKVLYKFFSMTGQI